MRRVACWLWGVDDERALGPFPGTLSLAAAFVAVFVAERLSGSWHYTVTNLRHAWGWSYPEIANGEVWRLVTSGFLHSDMPSPIGPFGLRHLLANLFALALFAPRFEARFGPWRVVSCFLAFHVASFVVWIPLDTEVHFGAGASGGLAGLTGVLLVHALRGWREARSYAVAIALFAFFWWGPFNEHDSSNQVHAMGALAGVASGVVGLVPGTGAVVAVAAMVVVGAVARENERPVTRYRTPARTASCTTTSPPGFTSLHNAPIEFLNASEERIVVYWESPHGRDVLIALEPGDRVEEWSWVGHRFEVTRDRGTCVTRVVVSREPTVFRYTGDGG